MVPGATCETLMADARVTGAPGLPVAGRSPGTVASFAGRAWEEWLHAGHVSDVSHRRPRISGNALLSGGGSDGMWVTFTRVAVVESECGRTVKHMGGS